MKMIRWVMLPLLLTTAPTPAVASSYVPVHWHRLLFEAGFVGIVECEVAGLIVAKYRVVESWKGPPRGASIAIGRATGAQPALCGDRFFMVTRKCAGPIASLSMSVRPGGGEPLLWRDIRPDY